MRSDVCRAFDVKEDTNQFPGDMPRAIRKANVAELQGRTETYIQYTSSVKADGKRYIIRTEPQKEGIRYMNRKWKETFISSLHTPFPSCMLDVEVLHPTPSVEVWLVFDLLRMHQAYLRKSLTHMQRLQVFATWMLQQTATSSKHTWIPKGALLWCPVFLMWPSETKQIHIYLKPHYPRYFPISELTSFPWPQDGVVWTALLQGPCYKWKPLSHITVDLQIGPHKQLLTRDGTQYSSIGITTDEQKNIGDIWECQPIPKGTRLEWKLLFQRTDKDKPNPKPVVEDALATLYEQLSLQDVLGEPMQETEILYGCSRPETDICGEED